MVYNIASNLAVASTIIYLGENVWWFFPETDIQEFQEFEWWESKPELHCEFCLLVLLIRKIERNYNWNYNSVIWSVVFNEIKWLQVKYFIMWYSIKKRRHATFLPCNLNQGDERENLLKKEISTVMDLLKFISFFIALLLL